MSNQVGIMPNHGPDDNDRLDVAAVKRAASGRWTAILPQITGIDASLLDGRNHPCPKCGGKDRFRCIDADAGALFCNQCRNKKCGDGFAAIQWLNECSFPEALEFVARYCNQTDSSIGHSARRFGGSDTTTSPSTRSKRNRKPTGKNYAAVDEARAACCSMMRKNGYEPGGEWAYHDSSGKPVALVLRFNHPEHKKEFRPVSLHGVAWFIKDPPELWPLYRLAELETASVVYVCEGEKSAEAMRSLGFVATTSAHGSGSAHLTDWSPLAGKSIIVFPDNDESGHKYSEEVAEVLTSLVPAATVTIVKLPGLLKGGDIVDWIELHGDAAELDSMRMELECLVANTAEVEPRLKTPADASIETTILIDERWPSPLDESAFYGVAGEIVRKVAPHTESDPVAILIQTLVALGSVIGRNAWFQVEATRHYANLFAVIVGSSSVSRKGTSGDHVCRVVRQVDENWFAQRTVGGLVSGEGLIWQVRDQTIKREPVREKGRKNGKIIDYQDVIVDHGVSDKRLLVIETEFSSVLKAKGRETNTLSEALRQAWDSGRLGTAAKNQPAKATDAHVSLIGHITVPELREVTSQTDMTNGFANRFLWCCCRRSKLLPNGGQIHLVDFEPEIVKLKCAVEFASTEREVVRDDKAAEEWRRVYPILTAERYGAVGAICNRGAAQVVRLSLLYALLDCSPFVTIDHLRAALALWKYCEDSVKYIFGHSLGNRTADSILSALKIADCHGMSRSEISNLFNRNRSKAELDAALQLLYSSKLAYRVGIPTGGRSIETWYLLNGHEENERNEVTDTAMSSDVVSFVSSFSF